MLPMDGEMGESPWTSLVFVLIILRNSQNYHVERPGILLEQADLNLAVELSIEASQHHHEP